MTPLPRAPAAPREISIPENRLTQIRHLSRPPIREAVFDIRVQANEALEVDRLHVIPADLRDALTTTMPIHLVESTFQIPGQAPDARAKTPVPPTARQTRVGSRHQNAEGTRIVQFRADGFTVNHLPPYEGWDSLHDMARQAWRDYVEVAQPQAVTRVAVRTINEIRPEPGTAVAEILRQPPAVSPGLPGRPRQISQQVELSGADGITILVSVQIPGTTGGDGDARVILDIDVFRLLEPSIDGDAVWPLFDRIRQVKNDVFFKMITDKAVEAFL